MSLLDGVVVVVAVCFFLLDGFIIIGVLRRLKSVFPENHHLCVPVTRSFRLFLTVRPSFLSSLIFSPTDVLSLLQ